MEDGFAEPRKPGLRPVQHPDLAYATRGMSRVQRPPLYTPLVADYLSGSGATMPDLQDGDAESSHSGSALDEVEGDNLDGFLTAIQEIVN